ncbi:L-rhamnose mutarotase [Echinicola rosea]|uniref:L-rhamnose mutarotase n=1 Tax=Echinicola rosea TaxID=1807691 RepID=A0ABQ1V2R0_9BACT|nr:L-rhamnose mutarotase [Echinicola rosea]GGF36150.1 hypothetical protein GCM10011339_25770 [Echinicola rosea]
MNTKQFRRFTYFIQTVPRNINAFFESTDWHRLLEKPEMKEIHDLKIYRKGMDYFILLDTSAILDNKALLKALNRIKAFQLLQEKLTANGTSSAQLSKPLERIFELEQQDVYSPEEGQLKNSIGKHKRFVWTLLLEPTLIDEYKRVHAMGMAWPEITNNLKTIGVKDMEIYLYENRAFLIMDTVPGFDLEKVSPTWQKMPRENEWQEYVAKFQQTSQGSSIQEKWQSMVKI